MKVEVDGIFDIIEDAITDYQIVHGFKLGFNVYELSLHIEEYIKTHINSKGEK